MRIGSCPVNLWRFIKPPLYRSIRTNQNTPRESRGTPHAVSNPQNQLHMLEVLSLLVDWGMKGGWGRCCGERFYGGLARMLMRHRLPARWGCPCARASVAPALGLALVCGGTMATHLGSQRRAQPSFGHPNWDDGGWRHGMRAAVSALPCPRPIPTRGAHKAAEQEGCDSGSGRTDRPPFPRRVAERRSIHFPPSFLKPLSSF